MALQSIGHFSGQNPPGGCWIDFAPTTYIDTFPEEEDGDLKESITLRAGKGWTRIVAVINKLVFTEPWKLVNGVLVPMGEVSMNVPADDINKLAGFWKLRAPRHVVLFRKRTGDTICLGTAEEGAQFGIAERTTGESTDFSGYKLTWTIARETPVPFYLGTAPGTPAAGGGGTVVGIDGTEGTLDAPDIASITLL